MYIPEGYSPDKKYPIAVFLHGDGHNGNAPHQVVTGGEATFVKRSIIETDEDCIYIVPAAKSRWLTVPNDKNTVYPYLDYSMSDATPSATLNAVRDLLHECIDVMAIDENRVYLIGYSRGTMAGFYWLSEEPELFAGALLCCGASDPASAHKYKDVPIWAFIGDKDPLVSTERFKAVFDAYKAAGGNGKFTFFEGGEHSLKSYMHAEAGVLEWLFSQKKA